MQKVALAGVPFPCSRFVFGMANLFNVGSEAQRARLLDAAVDHGFTHFDAAPLYGFGWAERDLASALKRHPHLTVTTKVGLFPPGGCDQSATAVFLRKAGGKALRSLSRPVKDFSLENANKALDGSLKRLGRGHIDLYLLHEPDAPLLDRGAWIAWLDEQIAAGKIRAYGIAAPAELLEPLLAEKDPLLDVVQTRDSLDRMEADIVAAKGRPLQFTYGYVSGARQRGDSREAREILLAALARNADGAILVSTTKEERLAQYAELGDIG
jgi:aryl-alcohol dehydrogenase-like predicted oxidoreductase